MDFHVPLHDPDFYRSDPYPAYQRLRREAPLYWSEEGGWWALARMEARIMFEELVPVLASASLAGEPTRVRSTMIPGIRHLPVRFAQRPATA